MAGPCSVENREQIERSAESWPKAGASVIRGGAFKPRSVHPTAFRAWAKRVCALLREAADRHGLLVVSEVMDQTQIALLAVCGHPAGGRAQYAELQPAARARESASRCC
jgi:3-deoxy-7-phosphoheptulonate synthase